MRTASKRRANPIVVLFASGLVTFFGFDARADTLFEFASCSPDVAEEVRRIAGLELRSIVPSDQAASTSLLDAIRIHVSCSAEHVQVQVWSGPRPLERSLDLAKEDARVRARVIALAIADLAAVHGNTRIAPPPDPSASAAREKNQETDVRETVRDRRPVPPSFSWELRATTTRFFDDTVHTWGGGARAWMWLGYLGEGPFRAAFGVDAQLENGSSTPTEGTVERTRLGFAGLGLVELPLGRWLPGLQIGFRLGPAWLRGRPSLSTDTGLSVGGLWGGPLIAPRLGYLLAQNWALLGSVELGAGVLSVEGVLLSGEAVRVGGLWWSPQVGLEFRH